MIIKNLNKKNFNNTASLVYVNQKTYLKIFMKNTALIDFYQAPMASRSLYTSAFANPTVFLKVLGVMFAFFLKNLLK